MVLFRKRHRVGDSSIDWSRIGSIETLIGSDRTLNRGTDRSGKGPIGALRVSKNIYLGGKSRNMFGKILKLDEEKV